MQHFWNQLKVLNSQNLDIPLILPKIAIFRFLDTSSAQLILNHLLFPFKIYVYTYPKSGYLRITNLQAWINEIKNTEEKLCENNLKIKNVYQRQQKITIQTNYQWVYTYAYIKERRMESFPLFFLLFRSLFCFTLFLSNLILNFFSFICVYFV